MEQCIHFSLRVFRSARVLVKNEMDVFVKWAQLARKEGHAHTLQLKKMNVIPLAILGVKWPFSKGRGR